MMYWSSRAPGWRAAVVCLPLAAGGLGAAEPSAAGVEFFEKKVRPALVQHCYECHSVKHEKAKGGLLLDSREAVLKGGDSGPAIIPGKPAESLLIKAVRRVDEDLQMPPKHKLDEQTIRAWEEWVRMGAPDPRAGPGGAGLTGMSVAEGKKFWSMQPVKPPAVPAVKNSRWVQTPVDAFILARLEAKGLLPSPRADARDLIRRATYDLTGLPPTPAEVEAFAADSSPTAFAELVDRLLASPAYGEKWGRHWLDVVRYADTAGCNSDFPIPPAYKYRNWVINAFNEDKPYDRFLLEQIAGDLLPASGPEERNGHLIATGYLAISRRFASQTNEFYLTLDDTVDNVGKTFLGLSLGCARCHDHKYDPVPTRDYYALYGIFRSTTYTFPGVEVVPNPRDYLPLGTAAEAARWKEYEGELHRLDLELRRLEPLTRGAKAASNDVAKVRAQMEEIKRTQKKMRENPPAVELAYGVQEGTPADARIMRKGEPHSLGEAVPRGFLQVLGGQQLKNPKESGRRELAQWLADPQNPLTARVMVNRIWQGHFGRGLVATPNDFGARGQPPTHPELLDYLAVEFQRRGWRLKEMHRLIMRSSAYQMTSEPPAAAANTVKARQADPANDLRWRFERRRLSAEELRDTLLALGGTLDRSMGGAHPFPPPKDWKYTQHNPFVADYPSSLRSVYLMQQRLRKNPFFETWDGADPGASTGTRPLSTTPLQALYLMNSELVHQQSLAFARRLQGAASRDEERVRLAYALAFGRPPSGTEIKEALEYLAAAAAALPEGGPAGRPAEAAWASYARVLFGANELIFVN